MWLYLQQLSHGAAAMRRVETESVGGSCSECECIEAVNLHLREKKLELPLQDNLKIILCKRLLLGLVGGMWLLGWLMGVQIVAIVRLILIITSGTIGNLHPVVLFCLGCLP